MGTRSLTVFTEDDGTEIVVLYRQYDGYMEGHGIELAKFLAPFALTNGLPMGATGKLANGMGCLAAQVISHFKGDEAGQFYLYPAGTRDANEEFIYTVYMGADSRSGTTVPFIRVHDVYANSILFDGNAAALVHRVEAEPATDWKVCQVCGDEMKHWNHRTAHFAKHHAGVDPAL